MLLTLVVVPVIYLIVDRLVSRFSKKTAEALPSPALA
jgi:hypothetical protein